MLSLVPGGCRAGPITEASLARGVPPAASGGTWVSPERPEGPPAALSPNQSKSPTTASGQWKESLFKVAMFGVLCYTGTANRYITRLCFPGEAAFLSTLETGESMLSPAPLFPGHRHAQRYQGWLCRLSSFGFVPCTPMQTPNMALTPGTQTDLPPGCEWEASEVQSQQPASFHGNGGSLATASAAAATEGRGPHSSPTA